MAVLLILNEREFNENFIHMPTYMYVFYMCVLLESFILVELYIIMVIRNIDLAANSFCNARHGHNWPSSFPENRSATGQHIIVPWQKGGGGCVLLVTQGRLLLPNGASNGT